MIFSSLSFLLLFLPLLFGIYFLIPPKYIKARKSTLLLFSVVFYTSGEPVYIFLIIFCIFITWLLSEQIEYRKKGYLYLVIAVNILPLVAFKYLGFILGNIIAITGINKLQVPDIPLPIGISFYTFQILSYIVDLYSGKIDRQKNIIYLILYVMLFPQLIAGPIVRYPDIQDAIENSRESWEKIQYGTGRFIVGLSKKVLIANQVGYISSEILSHPLNLISTFYLWIAIIAFALQIYFDFSGYSDMAIGLGKVFGFTFPENFDKPYMVKSIQEFWRKWHMTLGAFFRDYVYIPLGGNRVSTLRWIINVLVVWFFTGLWHGASWNYVIWGGYYAVLLLLEKGLERLFLDRIPKYFRWFLTIFLVLLGWAIFMADGYSMNELGNFITRLFYSIPLKNRVTFASMGLYGYIPYLILGIIIVSPTWLLIEKIKDKFDDMNNKVYAYVNDTVLVVLLFLCIIYIVGGSYNPFIYYRF